MIFREAVAADADAVAGLLTASWREAYTPLLQPELLRDRLPALHLAMWRDHFAAPRPGIVVLAVGEDGPRGFCAAWLEDAEAYVDNLHMRPGQRGGGLGPALLGRSVAALVARGATRAALTIIDGNDRAQRFYERLGGVTAQPYDAELYGVPTRYRRIMWDDARQLAQSCGASLLE